MRSDDRAVYVGPVVALRGRKANVRPVPETYDLPLEQRTLEAIFDQHVQSPEVHNNEWLSDVWREYPATDFALIWRE